MRKGLKNSNETKGIIVLLVGDSLKMKVPPEIFQFLICPLVKIVWSMTNAELPQVGIFLHKSGLRFF